MELPTLFIKVVVAPKDALKDVGVNPRKFLLILPGHGLKTEHESILRSRKDHIIQSRRYLIRVSEPQLLRTLLEHAIDLLECVLELEICVLRWDLHLDDQPIDFVDHHDHRQLLPQNVLNDLLGHQHHAFDCVDYQQNSFAETQTCYDFAEEVGVAGGVDEVEQIEFVFEVLEQEGDGGGFDGELLLLLVDTGVQPAVGLFEVPVGSAEVGLLDQDVHEGGFAVVEVAGHADVADASVALGHQVSEILGLVVGLEGFLVVVAFLVLS